VQNPILAYVLRVDPSLARPRIEKALAARGDGLSACYQELLRSLADLHYDPILEAIAARGLDDPDWRVRTSSAALLGRFGAPEIEAVLMEQYRRWSEKWAGRESELNPVFAEYGAQLDAIREGSALLHALTTATSWLTDANRLQNLLSMTNATRLRDTLEGHLNAWTDAPMTITVNRSSGPQALEARVAQYELRSMQALEDKLSQFPAGTAFTLQFSGPDSAARRESENRLSAFIRGRGMVVVAAQ
jgi:hypothetical protein